MLTTVLLGLLLLAALVTLALFFLRLRTLDSEHRELSKEHAGLNDRHHLLLEEHEGLKNRFRGVVDLDAEKQRVQGQIEAGRTELQSEKQRMLSEVETEHARIQADIARGQSEKQRVYDSLEAEKQRVRLEMEAEEQRRRVELEAERARLHELVGQIKANQQQALQELQEQRRNGEVEMFNLELSISKLREDLKALDEEANLQSFGFYKPRYDFASSERYQAKLDEIRESQKRMTKDKSAAVCCIEWTVNGNRAEGRKQINQTLKLILRAFNGECDAAIAKVKYNNIHVMEARISKAWEAINGLVGVQQCEIAPAYLDLKLKELYLIHEYQEKLQEEKEEQRRIREQMREEEIALREIERAQQEAEREERRYEEALRKAQEDAERAVGAKQQKLLGQIEELQRRLEEAHTNKERAVARAQMTRSGHVYIISNVGSFGEHVYKIGMTRRLDPMDRVRELGDASVPFHFDVHAIIYSDDAPTLENRLHRLFGQRRVNRVNERKEFFRVSIDEIAEAVRNNHGEIEITKAAEAVEYRKTLAMLQGTVATPFTDAPSHLEAIVREAIPAV